MNARIEKTSIIRPSLIPGGTKKNEAFAVIKADGEVYCYANTEEEARQALNEHLADRAKAESIRDYTGF